MYTDVPDPARAAENKASRSLSLRPQPPLLPLASLIPRLAGIATDRFPASGPCTALDQALLLRLAAAFRTPSNWPQPPELAGVDASVQVPNALQPMSGEFASGREVGHGNAAFFGPARLAGLRPRRP